MIELKNVSKAYRMGKVDVEALKNVSLKIDAGEFVAIIGPSGSGKSTLLHVLGFLDRPDKGSYTIFNKEITKLGDDELALIRNHIAGFVFQQFHLLPSITALQNVELPLVYAGKRHMKEKAQARLKEVNLSHRMDHHSNEMSGGEQQRVAIARSLVNDPIIIFADEPTGNLDSKSEQEIVGILQNLNNDGKTVIMVTHEREIAEHAQRVISMRDGEIISDEKVEKQLQKKPAIDASVSIDNVLANSHTSLGRAEFMDHLRQAFSTIFVHKVRSILSMLGIFIGVAAVIAMLALGEGAKESISKSLSSLGSNRLTLRPGNFRSRGVSLGAGAVTRFTLKDAEHISRLPDVKNVDAYVQGNAQLVYGNKNWNTRVTGAQESYAEMQSAIPTAGEFFTGEDVTVRRKVAVIGTTVASNLFGDTNPVGKTIKVRKVNFLVMGVLPSKGMGGWQDQDDVVVVPVTTAMYRLLGKEYVDAIDIEIKDINLMQEGQDAVTALVKKLHPVGQDKQDTFTIMNLTEIQEALKTTTRTMTWLLGSIAAISLLVGGIGIMNIMLVSVTERTREIGLRKSIGAQRKDILMQFLIESVVMTFTGGILGIIFGSSIAILMSKLTGWATSVSVFSVLLGTCFSVAVGIIFGILPARQASMRNPIEALRYEYE